MATTMAEQIIRCPNCGAKNRVTAGQREKRPVCGRCKKPLPLDGSAAVGPIEVTDQTFAELVERSTLPVLVDLWAPWCGPCQMIAPAVEQLAADFAGRARVVKVNIDDNQLTAGRFRVDSIPTLLLFKGGREVDRIVGLAQKEEISRRLAAIAG